ncbi:MAG: 5-amino-6-(D-ribitylamino)uracil--L-tyrosine 4-hydroxyphenyl transferase CofH [Actinomycetota bacterium]
MDPAVARALARSRAGDALTVADVGALLGCADDDLGHVLVRSRELRDLYLEHIGLPGTVTYSRKVFIPLTYLCRYRCSYCTFVKTRETPRAEFRSLDEVLAIASEGREWGCTEALFTLGEGAELRHPEAKAWLAERGYETTIDYLLDAAQAVVSRTGLLPHANPGAITATQMRALRDVTASQGVMMEQLADRLLRPGHAHAGAPGKAAEIRLDQLRLAAETHTPFTTGFLIGIGETLDERATTIFRLAEAVSAEDLPQVQEVIVQNFRAKPDTPMRRAGEPTEDEMVRAIAATRLILGPRVSVQAPPNLTPHTYGRYIDAGVNDWGGISPVTPDHVNPEMPWPSIDEVAATCAARGFALRQRLPVYPQYVTDERSFKDWAAPKMHRHILAASDAMGLAREERWYAGEGWTPVLRAAQPQPKRRALAMADNKPALTAGDVSKAFASHVREGAYGAIPDLAGVGFDDMLPDVASRTVLRHERADRFAEPSLRHPWVGPFLGPSTRASRRVRDLLDRAHQGERLEHPEVERLFRAEGADLDAVFVEADDIRYEMVGDEVSYVVNRNITYTNFCHTGCSFCGFARPVGHEDGYYFAPDEVGRKAREAWELGATEVCIQGGIHPHNTGEIYLEIARAVKAAAPDIHLHGFSPLEITVGAHTLGLGIERYLRMLRDAGLDSIPGTAAEILDTDVRPKITPQKLSADDWIDLMRTAHRVGIASTTTIMFGHIDGPRAWATHLLRLRDLQAETRGFTEFVPLPFVHHRTPMFVRGASRTGPTWRESLKIHALGRIVLHPHITNIQASWVKLGVVGVVASLDVGVNDFGGTLGEEHISRMAGASHGLGHSVREIESVIRAAGRTPVERTTTYGRPSVPYLERTGALVAG